RHCFSSLMHDATQNGTPLGGTGDFLEAGAAERADETGPRPRGGPSFVTPVHRVAFDDATALRLRVLARRLQQCDRHPFVAIVLAHEETSDRPHGFIVEPFQRARMFEPRKRFARSDAAPADRFAPGVSQYAGNLT